MNMGDEMATEQSGPLSWRDVYKAVGDSETRIIAKIDEAFADVSKKQDDHESRIRALEAGAAPPLASAASERASMRKQIEVLEDIVHGFTNRETGVFATLKGGQAIVLTLIVVASFVLSLIAALHANTPVTVNAP